MESMDNLPWIIVAIGASMGGLIVVFGFRNADKKPVSELIIGAVKQDWTPTGNIDLRASTHDGSRPQPIRLWVEENRIMETAVGQRVVELRWRLATIEEGKELVVCWNAKQTSPAALLPGPCLVDR
jgi:hypothetical protein